MHYYHHNKLGGMILVTLGMIAIGVAIGPFLLPLFLVLGGLFFVNLGLRMAGKPPLFFMAHDMWHRKRWR